MNRQRLWFIVKEGVCRERSSDVHGEVVYGTMSGVHDIGLVLKQVVDTLYNAPLSEHDLSHMGMSLEMQHSYVIELKYAKGREPEERVEQLRQEAIEQALRYAATDTVQTAIGHTTLHRIVVVFHGMEMVVCEEI